MTKQIFLSIIIPAYNEEANFRRGCLEQVAKYLQNQRSWEVILVDDGSTDKTPQMLAKFTRQHPGWIYRRIEHGGKLAAIQEGIRLAMGRYILFTDFDQSTPLASIERTWLKFGRGAGLVIGQRQTRKAESLAQMLRSEIFSALARIILSLKVKDTQCGFKVFKNGVAKDLFASLKVHRPRRVKKAFMGAFDAELLFLAQKRGYRIATIPVNWRRQKSGRLSRNEPLEMLLALIKIRLTDWRGNYQ